MLIWVSRKWMYISVRVWGISALSSVFQEVLKHSGGDPAEDGDVTHDVEASWSSDVWDDSAGLCSSLISSWNTPPSEIHWIPEFLSHGWCIWRGSDWLLLVCWWSRWERRKAISPLMRFDINTPTDEVSFTSQTFSPSENISVILLSSRPSKMNTTLHSSYIFESGSRSSGWKSSRSLWRLYWLILDQVQLSKWKEQTWNLHLDWLFPRPSPELTSAQRWFSNSSDAFSKNGLDFVFLLTSWLL